MANPHDDDRGSVIARLQRVRDILLGREPSKITEIDDEIDALTLEIAPLSEIMPRLNAMDAKLDQIIAAVGTPAESEVNVAFGTAEPKEN